MAPRRRSPPPIGSESLALDLGCEPSKQSEPSPAPKPKFVDSRESSFEERIKLENGRVLVLRFDNLARIYRGISVLSASQSTPSSSTIIAADGSWMSRDEIMPILRKEGLVPAGWERVYGSDPTH